MNEIFLDTETTGLSVNEGHRIVEIACVETNDLSPTKKIFHRIINPQRDVPVEAFKVHGFSTDFLKDKETFDKIADELLEFIKNKKIIIHNASFDLGFLNHELKLIKKNEISKDNIVDSLEVARNKFPGTSNSLDALCRRFNIDLSRRGKHNALLDCELLREVYINLLDAKEPKLIFSNDSNSVNFKNRNNAKKNYCKIIVKPTDDELKLHKEFLKKELKKNYY
jgi:DNA polymerase III subunit epsilon